MKEVDFNIDNLPMERTLGLQWNTVNDNLTFHVQVKEQPDTRRGILSIVASIYDPLELVAQFVLLDKIILQGLRKRGMTWDDALPSELRPRRER